MNAVLKPTSLWRQPDSTALFAADTWFDPVEAGIRDGVRRLIEELLEQVCDAGRSGPGARMIEELTAALERMRHERAEGKPAGYRNGTRRRQFLGSFGSVELSVPWARLATQDGTTQEFREAIPTSSRL